MRFPDHCIQLPARPAAPRTRTKHWLSLPAMISLFALFASWDAGATSLFLGAVVPLHICALRPLLQLCPHSRVSTLTALARFSLLIPVAWTSLHS